MRITLTNIENHKREEYTGVLALLTSPTLESISFTVSNPDGSVSEVKRFDLTVYEMLVTSV